MRRGSKKNLKEALKDKRVKLFDIGGDITQLDLLNEAMKNIDGVFHFAALMAFTLLGLSKLSI